MAGFLCTLVLLLVGYNCYLDQAKTETATGSTPCRYASRFSVEKLLNDQTTRDYFVSNASYWEGNFNVHGVGYNAFSGLSYDGHGIDYNSGEKHEPQHGFSASSKESIHINMLTLAVEGNKNALLFFNATASKDAKLFGTTDPYKVALLILERKINSYENFNKKYPGFGGYLPWFKVNDDGIDLLWDWLSRVPSLDNGQLVWSIVAVIDVLKNAKETTLAARYEKYLQILIDNSLTVFYESEGRIRTVTLINDTKAPCTRSNYKDSPCFGDPCYLDDPYEGELMAFFMDLYSDWNKDYTTAEREKIWAFKRKKLVSIDYVTPQGNITVEKGWWYSSHEKWKYLDLPYTSVPINNRVFLNGEKARTWHSYLNKIPGMYASVTNVGKDGNYDTGYISACGIQSISYEKVQYTNVVTPYGAFPVIMASQAHGLAWYYAMISGARMQGPYGSTEASNTAGSMISPVVTWDSKITTVVAMLGGVASINERVMKQQNVYDRFHDIVDREWSRVFTTLRGESLEFKEPSAIVPCVGQCDFTTCKA